MRCWVKIRSDRVAGRSASQLGMSRWALISIHPSRDRSFKGRHSISANRFGEGQYRQVQMGIGGSIAVSRKVLGGCQHRIGLAPRIKAPINHLIWASKRPDVDHRVIRIVVNIDYRCTQLMPIASASWAVMVPSVRHSVEPHFGFTSDTTNSHWWRKPGGPEKR